MKKEIKSIQKLSEEFEKLHKSDNLIFIKFYEKNIDSIETIDIKENENSYTFKTRLLCEYGMSLSGLGMSSKAIEILSVAIPKFEKLLEHNTDSLKESQFYKSLLWNFSISFYEIKQYNKALVNFTKLNNYFPDSEIYNSWISLIKINGIRKQMKYLWYFIFAFILAEFTIFEWLNTQTQYNLSIFGGILLLIAAGYELYLYTLKRKKKRKPNIGS